MENSENKNNQDKKVSLAFDSFLFFKLMFENAEHTAILVMDPQGTILDANYGLKKSFGYPREFLIGKNFSLLFIEEDRRNRLPERELKEVMQTGTSNDNNYLKQYDGSLTWVHGESIYTKDET